MKSRPAPSEYAPYCGQYVGQVPDGDILEILATLNRETQRLLEGIDEDRGGYRYAPDKWSIKQIIGPISDVERVFTYRALAFA
ncbi:MAG: DinB family protein, partial [Candidatus Krumholzibacteriia bacterium]